MIRKTILAAFILCHTLGCSQLSRHQMCPADSFSANGSVVPPPGGDRAAKRELRAQAGYTAENGWRCFSADEVDQLGSIVEELKKDPIGVYALETLHHFRTDICVTDKEVYARYNGQGKASYNTKNNTVFLREDELLPSFFIHEIAGHADQTNSSTVLSSTYMGRDNAASSVFYNLAKEVGAHGLQTAYLCHTLGDCAGFEGEREGMPTAQMMDVYMSNILRHPQLPTKIIRRQYSIAQEVFQKMVKAGVTSSSMFEVEPISSDDLGVLLRGRQHKKGETYPKTEAALQALVPSIQERLKGIYRAALYGSKP